MPFQTTSSEPRLSLRLSTSSRTNSQAVPWSCESARRLLHAELIWIDEALTPDSSRFWPAAHYSPGGPQASFDKQFVRDYLERMQWPKTLPGPELPPEVVEATRAKYREAYRILAGRDLD